MTLGRNCCGNWEGAVGHEWLVTNGLGGYACGTVALANTRRYHAFLTASLNPPVERTLLVAKIDVSASYRGGIYPLSANEFAGGAIDPRGFIHIESFAVLDGIPTWHFAFADALIEQRIFMAPNANVSYLTLALKRGAGPVQIEFKPLVTYRDHHGEGRGERPFAVEADRQSCAVRAFEGARTLTPSRQCRRVRADRGLVLEFLAPRGGRAGLERARGFVRARALRGGADRRRAAHRHRQCRDRRAVSRHRGCCPQSSPSRSA